MSRCSPGAGKGSHGAKEPQVTRNASHPQLIPVWSTGSVLSMRGREPGFGGCGRAVPLKSRGVPEGLFLLSRPPLAHPDTVPPQASTSLHASVSGLLPELQKLTQ